MRDFISAYPMTLGCVAFALALAALYGVYRLLMHSLLSHAPEPALAGKATPAAVEDLENAIGGRLPQSLRDAYLAGQVAQVKVPSTFRPTLLHLGSADDEERIASFTAASAAANETLRRNLGLSEDAFVFASNDFGNFYFVRGGDSAVYFWDHETGNCVKCCEAFDDLWTQLPLRSSSPMG